VILFTRLWTSRSRPIVNEKTDIAIHYFLDSAIFMRVQLQNIAVNLFSPAHFVHFILFAAQMVHLTPFLIFHFFPSTGTDCFHREVFSFVL
jgi:hypothetical protein